MAIKIQKKEDLLLHLKSNSCKYAAVAFYSTDHPQSKQVQSVMELLKDEHEDKLNYFVIDVTETNDFKSEFDCFKIDCIPCVLLFNNGSEVGRIQGAHCPKLVNMIENLCNNALDSRPTAVDTSSLSVNETTNITTEIKRLIHSNPVLMFIKGTKEEPYCQFSRKAVSILNYLKVDFNTFDIFSNEKIRQEMKIFSDWPTFPQLYVNGEFIGGLDIMIEMLNEGSLLSLLKDYQDNMPEKKLKELIMQSPIMIFMKGDRLNPFCRFSRELMNIFDTCGIHDFQTFNILEDDYVRQKLKEYSNWPTYPQIYINGELLGGVDIVKQILESGGSKALHDEIERCLNNSDCEKKLS